MTDAKFIRRLVKLVHGEHLTEAIDMIAKDKGYQMEAIAQRLEDDEWIPVAERIPNCSKDADSFGESVLVYPPCQWSGQAAMWQAFYGCRQTKEPNFYLYGAVFYPTHWKPLPKGPL
jgi:hypothetical protein